MLVLVLGLLITRSIATSAVWAAGDMNKTGCGNEMAEGFRGYLPDCRAYEMVSPPYKEGAPLQPGAFYAISPDGTRVIGLTIGAFAETGDDLVSRRIGAFYEFTRESTGWSTRPLDPPITSYTGASLEDASSDLSNSIWFLHQPSQPANVEELYLRSSDGVFTRVGPGNPGFTAATAQPATPFQIVKYLGASADLAHILVYVTSENPEQYRLWQGDTSVTAGAVSTLYEYTGTEDKEPMLVGVNNEGRLEGHTHVNENAKLIGNCGTVLGGSEGNEGRATMYNAISEDGSRVFFTTIGKSNSVQCEAAAEQFEACTRNKGTPEECEKHAGPPPIAPRVNEVYARIGGSKTVDVSEPALSTPGRECTGICKASEENEENRSEGIFEGASQDGSKAFVRTTQPLVNGDKDRTSDLYEVELGGSSIKRVILVSEGGEGSATPGEGAEVLGVARISEDGSHIYFVAKGELTGENPEGKTPETAGDNLYVYNTGTERLSFVATLSTGDEADWSYGNGPVQATPDGQFLVFGSAAHLTPDDQSGEGAPQIFEYDAQNGTLARVSIGQRGRYLCTANGKVEEGYNCDGNTSKANEAPVLPVLSNRENDLVTAAASSLAVSGDGSAVVFSSLDALAPQAVPGVRNVYEYRDGNVYLISSGQGASAPGSATETANGLLGIDASGKDVFFGTGNQLLPEDSDTVLDFYDAREGGGFPGSSELSGCLADACQGALALAPLMSGSASAGVSAEGNLAPPTVKAHKKRSKGKAKKKAAKRKGKARKAKHAAGRANRKGSRR